MIEKLNTYNMGTGGTIIGEKINEIIDLLRKKFPEEFEPELLPCPFCSSGKYLFVGTANEIDSESSSDGIAVCCDYSKGGCGAVGGYRSTKEEAIKAWNRRADK